MPGYINEYLPFYDVTVAQILGPWNYTAYVYIAFDGPTAASPAWVDVTQYVDVIEAGITITRGRPDGESDPQVGTCTLTVDNTDGRWSPANPSGAWYGLIHKGCWLRVDVLPPSGTVSTRFVGFIQQLPVSWEGKYSKVAISASDRFVLLGNGQPLNTAIFEEWTADPVGAAYISAYWSLHEPSGAAYVSDASGNAPAGTNSLAVRSIGVPPGGGITFSNAPGPGYDGTSTVTFAPSGTPIPSVFGGNTGSLPNGSCLIGATQPSGNVYDISMWINTTVANQPIFSWADPTINYAWGAAIGSDGRLDLWQAPLSGTSSSVFSFILGPLSNYPLNDGIWHMVTFRLQTVAGTPNGGGSAFLAVYVDGTQIDAQFLSGSLATALWPQSTLSRLTVGGAEGWNVDVAATGLCLFTGSISDLVLHQGLAWNTIPDTYGPYQAGTSMWQSPNAAYSVPESCGRRIVRLASYAGMPAPEVSFTAPGEATPLFDVTLGTTSFVNIPAETAHPAGFQQMFGQLPLAAMQVVAHTENMPLFIDRQGRLTLQPSTLRQNPTSAFTIDARDLEGETQWADDFQYLQNQTVVTPSGQGSLTVNTNGTASQALHGLYSGSVDTVTVNALESASLGAAINLAGADPAPRHNPLACEVATLATQTGYGAAWYDAVLAAEISTVIQVVNWPSQSPGGSSGTYYIEGYTETLTAGQHMLAWNTSPTQGATYRLDSPTLGLLDTPGITLAY